MDLKAAKGLNIFLNLTQEVPVDIAYGLPDSTRTGSSVCLAPGCNWLAVVTDSFGRITLIDVTDGYILRMWKGTYLHLCC